MADMRMDADGTNGGIQKMNSLDLFRVRVVFLF